jgi:hypothetical protein
MLLGEHFPRLARPLCIRLQVLKSTSASALKMKVLLSFETSARRHIPEELHLSGI